MPSHELNEFPPVEPSGSPLCPACGKGGVQRTLEEETFEYGGRDKQFTVTARVPVYTCPACGYAFRTGETEDVKHEAACRQLGVFTPAEVLGLREKHGL